MTTSKRFCRRKRAPFCDAARAKIDSRNRMLNRECGGSTLQAVRAVERSQRLGRIDLYLRPADAVDHIPVAAAICSGGNGDVTDHIPLHAIAPPLQSAAAISLEPAAPEVAVQAGRGGDIQKNEPCCPR